MNLYAKLCERAAQGRPLRRGLIGAGKFGSMYYAQVPKTPGVHLVGIADLAPANTRANLARVGWPAERAMAASLNAALMVGATHVSDDWQALVAHPQEGEENLGALGWAISEADMAAIDAIFARHNAVTMSAGWLEDA